MIAWELLDLCVACLRVGLMESVHPSKILPATRAISRWLQCVDSSQSFGGDKHRSQLLTKDANYIEKLDIVPTYQEDGSFAKGENGCNMGSFGGDLEIKALASMFGISVVIWNYSSIRKRDARQQVVVCLDFTSTTDPFAMKDLYMTPTEIASFCRPERIGRVTHIEFNGVDHYSCMLSATGVVNCLSSVYNLPD